MKFTAKYLWLILLLPMAAIFVPSSPAVFAQSLPASNLPGGNGTSLNWSGYAVTGNDITTVSGSWMVPQVSGGLGLTSDATWIGIGGVNSTDLIQIGTENFSTNGQITHQAFYEMLPQSSQTIPVTVNTGDSVSASITQTSPGQWLLSIHDNTNGQSFQTTTDYNSSLSSAEWIEEMPSNTNNSLVPLDNFGTLSFSGSSFVENGSTYVPGQFGAQAITMMSGSGQALATVSGWGSDSASFTVTRTSAASTSSANWQGGFSGRGYRRGSGMRGYSRLASGQIYRVTYFGGGNSRVFGMLFSRFFNR